VADNGHARIDVEVPEISGNGVFLAAVAEHEGRPGSAEPS
jgi:hypothetical protein